MSILETHTVPKDIAMERLQEYGVGIFKHIPTKSSLKKAIGKKLVLVDGVAARTGTFIRGGETIHLKEFPIKNARRELKLKLEVIFEDEHLAVINKPPGILVSGNSFKTVANGLSHNLKKSKRPDAVDPKPVHRLDYPTTGLLLVGKTSSSMIELGNLFMEKNIHKTYYAVTIGQMGRNGTIDLPVDGKVSLSEYEVLKSVTSKRFGLLNLVRLMPKTGRRHQLRKHLCSVGNPILGDDTYFLPNLILKGKGLYLHAAELKFKHPFTGKPMDIQIELPEKFLKIFGGH
ncbi:RluA family pseudouridine synthase [Maribacter cobaltidurans]|uniref:RluA family pseudouridine synthase n=1 Tax=Maribacter cobaltidurans TaxID=1178778 RepID=A0ABU7IW80_9FLAO|nr:RluA family pseudouridine synthase [Maribacter cobaltidurans]MEE1977083.1 RluA family pseudouridine synthase [Maribacter cobaltidurans]